MFKSLRLAASFRDPVLHRRDDRLVFNTANEMGFAGATRLIMCTAQSGIRG